MTVTWPWCSKCRFWVLGEAHEHPTLARRVTRKHRDELERQKEWVAWLKSYPEARQFESVPGRKSQ